MAGFNAIDFNNKKMFSDEEMKEVSELIKNSL